MYTGNNFYPNQGMQYTSSPIPEQVYPNQMGMQTVYQQPMYQQVPQPIIVQQPAPVIIQQPVAVPLGDPYCLNCHGAGYRNGKRCMCIGGTSGIKTAITAGIVGGVVDSLLGPPRHHHHPPPHFGRRFPY